MSEPAKNILDIPVICSQGGVPYNNHHIEYWKCRALLAEQSLSYARSQLVKAKAALEDCHDLIKQLDYVHQHPEYQSIWTVNQMHCGPYSGPKYDQFMERARKSIVSLSDDLKYEMRAPPVQKPGSKDASMGGRGVDPTLRGATSPTLSKTDDQHEKSK